MWQGELLYCRDDKDESGFLAWRTGTNEDWEDEKDGVINGRFVVERVVEEVSVTVFVFVLAVLDTTVHMLFAATEDEEGDCSIYPDW